MGVLALGCAGALAIGACGSDDDSATDDSATNAAAVTTGGEKASGEPIKVGFLVVDQGVGAIPEPKPAGEAAAKRINEQMGGINGRPLELIACSTDASPEKNIGCANQFVQDKVAAVVDGFDYVAGAALPILQSAKIPLVGPMAFAPQTDSDRASFYFGASQGALGIAPLLSFKDQGQQKVTLASGDVPAARAYTDGFIAPAAKALGLDFQAVYYSVTNPNFQSLATTLAATKPDVAGAAGSGNEGQCTSLIEALRGIGYDKSVFAGFCTQFIKAMGAEKAGSVQMYGSVWLPQMKQYAPPEVQKQLDTAQSDLEAAGDASKQGFFSYATYGTVMTFADVLRGIDGTIDNVTITKALKGIKDMPSFLGPPLTCDGSQWPKASACTNQVMVATLQPDGSLKPNADGGFLTVSPSALPAAG